MALKKPAQYDDDAKAFRIQLSGGLTALVDARDIARVAKHNWCATRNPWGFYGQRKVGNRSVYLHRFILERDMDMPTEIFVDHINGDGLDCRRSNLRWATKAQNVYNSAPPKGARFKGVRRRGDRWIAAIGSRSQGRVIGSFDTEDAAARAYDQAAIELYGEFARLNLPGELV